MEDNIWLRLITVGLVLTALAVGYFLLSGKLSPNSARVKSEVSKSVSTPSPSATVLGENTNILPSIVSPTPTPNPNSAFSKIAERNQNKVTTLPKTGFPVFLAVAFSASAIISGWSLRKYPN